MTSNLSGVTNNPATSNAITMTVNAIPATPTASSNSPVCAGANINLSTSTVSGAAYNWTGPNGYTSTQQNPVISNVTTAMAGTYSLAITVNGCTSNAGTTNVTVNTGPTTPTASSNSPICVNSTLSLSTPTVSGASYSWSGPNGFTSSQQNPTIPNATSAAAGTYSVSVTLGGCPSLGGTTTVAVNSAPVANFSATPTSTNCSGLVQFTDASTGNPSSWLWNFGDGNTSTSQNPSNTYLASGTYSVTLTASNNCGNNQSVKTNYITVNVPTAPTVAGDSRCGTGTLNLSASGNGTLNWYDAQTGGNLVYTGTNYTTPSLSTTTTYYVESTLTQIGASQYVGPINTTGAGAVNTSQSWLIFDCLAPMRLVSVSVYASTAGLRLIELKNASGTTLQSANINIPAGSSRITLNFDIPVGTDYQLVAPANCNLYRLNSGVTYPYTINGLVSIKNSNAGTTYYYYFYDWEVQTITSCSSARVPVTATVNQAVAAGVNISVSANSICAGTSVTFTATPTNGGTSPVYQWKVNGNNVGTNSPTYTTTTLANNDVVTCQMTSNATCISGNTTVNSNAITMIVSSAYTPAVSISASSNNICAGTSVTFTASPTNGGTPTYQWKLNNTNVGTNSATYTNTNLNNGDVVSCVMTSTLSCLTQPTANSNAITMIVNSLVTPIINISTPNTIICPNQSVTFTATTINAGTSPSYQWKVNGINAGTNSAVFTANSLNNNDVVACVLTSSESCLSANNVSSNSLTITVDNTVPTSSFTYTQNELDFGFTNTSIGASSYLWNFGDGTTSTLENPTHTYATSGIYVVTLTAYSACDSNQVLQSVNAIGSAVALNPKSFTVAIYPNPTQDLTTVELKGYECKDVEIIVYDAVGKKVYSYKLQNAFGNSKVNIDMTNYEKGIYNFTIRFNKESQRFKVVKK